MSCNPAHVLVRLVVSLGAVLPPTALYAASSHNPIRRTTSSASRSSSRRPPPPTTTNHHQPPRRPRRWLAPASVHVQKTMFRKPRVFGQPHEQVVCTSSWIGWVRLYVRVVLECRARAGVRASTDGCCGCAMAVRRGMLCVRHDHVLCLCRGQMARVGCVVHRLLNHPTQPRLTAHGMGVLVALLCLPVCRAVRA